MTTNLGTKDISKGVSVGFGTAGQSKGSYDRMKAKVADELKGHFRPEFLNRVDDTIVFHQLSEEEIFAIVDLMIAKVDDRLKDRDMGIELRPAAKSLLSSRGYDPVLGARPLRRTIQREIEDNLSEKILFGEVRPGQIVVVDTDRDGTGEDVKFTFTGVPKPESLPEEPTVAAIAASEAASGGSSTGGGTTAAEGPGTAQALG
jgi:ATP-dependent Clp protease ATP-binding subunit ClpC